MISILILVAPMFFIYRYYAELAFEHNRSRVGFGILGIGAYLLLYFVFSFISALIGASMIDITLDDTLATMNYKMQVLTWSVLFISIALSSLSIFFLFRILRNNWTKRPIDRNSDLLDK